MEDETIQPRPYLKLLLFAALLGLISAVITFIFMALVNVGTSAVWETAAAATGLSTQVFTLLVCTMGGLLVGVLVKRNALIVMMCVELMLNAVNLTFVALSLIHI